MKNEMPNFARPSAIEDGLYELRFLPPGHILAGCGCCEYCGASSTAGQALAAGLAKAAGQALAAAQALAAGAARGAEFVTQCTKSLKIILIQFAAVWANPSL